MKNLYLPEILKAIGGQIFQGNGHCLITAVAVYAKKTMLNNTLYFHLEKGDANFHKSKIADSTVIITEKPAYMAKKLKNTIVKVANIHRAYWRFVRYYRSLFNIPVIGITGTCGKTTTTEMVKKILNSHYNVQATQDGNNCMAMNLPYLLGIDERTEAAVFELGVIKPGDIKRCCVYFQPRIGVLLNIGVYHLQGCNTMDNYIKAKAEILEGLRNRGILIVNADDENIKRIDFCSYQGKIINIGLSEDCHYRASGIQYTNGGLAFTLYYKGRIYPVFIQGYGKHNVYNALAAIAAAHSVNAPIEAAIKALADFSPVRQHLQFCTGINGSTIIDDTWNCTPPAVKAALEVLKDLASGRKKVAVIGYMPRLGENGKMEYPAVGESVVKAGVDVLVTIGAEAKDIGVRAVELGMDKKLVVNCNTGDEVAAVLQPLLNQNTLVLLKFPYKSRLRKIPSFQKMFQNIFAHP